MSDKRYELISTGGLAKRLGRSITGIRKLQHAGSLPEPIRLEGSGRFAWRTADLEGIEERLANRHPRRVREGVAS